ncbi:MAG: hypothetical protein H0U76_15985 [Ktedonobacteraceae bacterium]|nr:hypothetical protein [Ktedonobacteraceae bacterium]MBA3825187.1 hypothetical protein [Ktedonobacterales bacterium]
MALELYMLGLIVKDMSASVTFYQRLGLDIPEGSEAKTHVEVKMGSGLTFFLDSKPARWDAQFVGSPTSPVKSEVDTYGSLLEFYLESQGLVEAKYTEMTGFGYESFRAPYVTPFGMCFAMLHDPDGNTILLSGMVKTSEQ